MEERESSLEKSARQPHFDNLDTIAVIGTLPHPKPQKQTLFRTGDTLEVHSSEDGKKGDLDIKDLSTEQEDMNIYLKHGSNKSAVKQSGRNSPEFQGNTDQGSNYEQLTARSNQLAFKMNFDTSVIKPAAERSLQSKNQEKQNRTFADNVLVQTKSNSSQEGKFVAQNTLNDRAPEEEDDDDISAMSISQFGALDKSVGNVSAISGMYTKRSPYVNRFKNMESEESLSLTPNSLNKSEIAPKSVEKESVHAENLTSSTADLKQNNLKH